MATIIAVADEFVVSHDEDGFIHILDGEQTIRLTIDAGVYIKLCKMSVTHYLRGERIEG